MSESESSSSATYTKQQGLIAGWETTPSVNASGISWNESTIYSKTVVIRAKMRVNDDCVVVIVSMGVSTVYM